MRSCQRTQCWPFYSHSAFAANWKLKNRVLHWQTENQKNRHFEVSSLIACNKEPFLNQTVMYNNKWQPAQWLDWKEAPKHFPKPNLHQKKGHGHCLMVCCPSDPLQLSESLQNSANWWDAPKLQCLKPILVKKNGPILIHNNTWPHVAQSVLQKLNKLGYKLLPHPPYSPDLLSTDYHFFRLLNNFFPGKMLPQSAGGRNAFQEFTKFQSMDFYATGINKFISRCQKWL